jgi:hypothetical protein
MPHLPFPFRIWRKKKKLIGELGQAQFDLDIAQIISEFQVSYKQAVWNYETYMELLEG